MLNLSQTKTSEYSRASGKGGVETYWRTTGKVRAEMHSRATEKGRAEMHSRAPTVTPNCILWCAHLARLAYGRDFLALQGVYFSEALWSAIYKRFTDD